MNFSGFVGPTYNLKSVNVDSQRCVNLFPEIIESGTGKEAQIAYLKSCYGYIETLSIGSGPIRCIHEDYSGRIFIISGSQIYLCTFSGGDWTTTSIGILSTSTGLVKAKSAKDAVNEYTVFVDGVDCYAFWYYGTGSGDFGTFASYGWPPIPFCKNIEMIDGYFIYVDGGQQFFVSDIGTFGVSALSFASSEGSPDKIISAIANNRELILINETTTEFFYDSGNSNFPFERISGGFVEKGGCAVFSTAKIDGVVFWLGQDASGVGQIYAMNGHTPQRVSTHAVEYAIATYSNISAATAYTYSQDGHYFYVINFDEATWVYDLSTKQWHERAYYNSGNLERHRFETCCYLTSQGVHLFGDYQNNKIYLIDKDSYSDNGNSLVRMRRTPHVSSNGNWLFHESLLVDMETGIGRDSGLGVNPQVMLRYSNDGGHTWSSESWTSAGQNIGGIGEFKKRVKWRRLGKARDRVYEVKITDPVKVNIIGAQLEVQVGGS